MDPCEFELPSGAADPSHASSQIDEGNKLEFEGCSPLLEDTNNYCYPVDIVVVSSSSSEESMLVYSKGRYKITLESYGPYGTDTLVSELYCSSGGK